MACFSLDWAQAAWQNHLTSPLTENGCTATPYPIFLGVRHDRQLTFGELVQKLCQLMSGRINLLLALGGMTWGWHTLDRCRVYTAIVRSMLEYAATARVAWLSANMLRFSWRRPEPSQALSTLLQLKQTSWTPRCPLFQRISKHLPPKSWRVGQSSTSWWLSSNPLHRTQTVPEEERLEQQSIYLS